MKTSTASDTDVLRAAYAAFNARDIDAALALMAADVTWPMAFKGGFVRGPDEIRAYWSAQWREINPHVDPVGFVELGAGQVLVDEHVGHRFTIETGLIRGMEVCPLPVISPA